MFFGGVGLGGLGYLPFDLPFYDFQLKFNLSRAMLPSLISAPRLSLLSGKNEGRRRFTSRVSDGFPSDAVLPSRLG